MVLLDLRVCVFVFLLCSQNHFLACAGFFRLTVLPRQMFPNCLTGKLCLAGVAKVPRQVERLTWAQNQKKRRMKQALKRLYMRTRLFESITKMKRTADVRSFLPSTREVSSVTLAAFLRPAGRLRPRRSNFSRRHRPPFLDFALWKSKITFFDHPIIHNITRLHFLRQKVYLETRHHWSADHFS